MNTDDPSKQDRGRPPRGRPTESDGGRAGARVVVDGTSAPAVKRAHVTHHVVDSTDDGRRLDNFLLRRASGVPKSHVYRIIRSGEVRVNGGRAKPASRVHAGDRIRMPPMRQAARVVTRVPDELAETLRARVVFEHTDFLALAKPAGLAVHAGSGAPYGLIEGLRQALDAPRLELVHRLDRATSGILLVARDNAGNRALQALFRNRTVEKRYLALVDGWWPEHRSLVDVALRTSVAHAGERRTRVSRDGKRSVTRFRVRERFPAATLLEASLETGRTHQIRVHATHVGCPIVGDRRYGDNAVNASYRRTGLGRMFLHAERIGFDWHGESIVIEAAVDGEWCDAISRIRHVDRGARIEDDPPRVQARARGTASRDGDRRRTRR